MAHSIDTTIHGGTYISSSGIIKNANTEVNKVSPSNNTHYDSWDTSHSYGYTPGTSINQSIEEYGLETEESNSNLNSFSNTYNEFQNLLNELLTDYTNYCDNTNVTLSSKYNFITSLDEYSNVVIANGGYQEEIFVLNTETGKYEKTTIEQWISYILNGAYFDFSVEDPNSPIQLVYLDDGETRYHVDYKKLKEYYNRLNSENGLYIIDNTTEEYQNMSDDYNNLSNLYQQYSNFSPYMSEFITTQIINDIDTSYQNMTKEQISSSLTEVTSSITNSQNKELGSGLYYSDLDNLMTKDQKLALISIYQNEGLESATEYIEILKSSLIQAKAMNQVLSRLEHYIDDKGTLNIETLKDDIENGNVELDEDLSTFLLSGGYGLADGVANFFNGFDYADLGEYDVGDYKRMYFAQAIASSGILNANYTLSSSIGQMAPVIAMSYTLNTMGFSQGTIALVTGFTNATSIFGNTLDSSLKEGIDTDKAIAYSVLTAIISSTSEYFIGGLPGLSKNVEITKIGSTLDFLRNMINEGIQEGGEELIDAGLRTVLFDEPINITDLGKETFASFLYGALTAGFYNGVNTTVSLVINGTTREYTIEQLQEMTEYMQENQDATVEEILSSQDLQNISQDTTINTDGISYPSLKTIMQTLNCNEIRANRIQNIIYKLGGIENCSIERATILYDNKDSLNQLINEGKISSNIIQYMPTTMIEHIIEFENYDIQTLSQKYNLSEKRTISFQKILNSIINNEQMLKIFTDATTVAINEDMYNDFFYSYRDHTIFHTAFVAEYATMLAEKLPSNLNVNINEVLYGAMFHDLGMRGGYYYNSQTKQYELVDSIDTNSNGWDKDYSYKSEMARKSHPLNSALAILTNNIVPKGVDVDVIALLAMSHSKSTSGIKDFSNPQMWKECVAGLNSALKQYNNDNDTNFSLDTEKLYAMINNETEFTRLVNEALVIRDGDANSSIAIDENGNTLLQTGAVSTVTNKNPRGTNYNAKPLSQEEETKGIQDIITNCDGTTEEITNGFSKRIHAGELNTQFASQYDGTNYRGDVTLVTPNEYLNSSWQSIAERLGEVKTCGNCKMREFVIHLPIEAEGTELYNFYKQAIDDYIIDNKIQSNFDIRIECDG